MRVNIHSTNMHNDNFIDSKEGEGCLTTSSDYVYCASHSYIVCTIQHTLYTPTPFYLQKLCINYAPILFCSLTIIPSVKIFCWQQLFQVQNQCIFLKHNTILAISKAQVARFSKVQQEYLAQSTEIIVVSCSINQRLVPVFFKSSLLSITSSNIALSLLLQQSRVYKSYIKYTINSLPCKRRLSITVWFFHPRMVIALLKWNGKEIVSTQIHVMLDCY